MIHYTPIYAIVFLLFDHWIRLTFIPMSHVGTRSFYADVKHKISKAKRDGYVLFYEHSSAKHANKITLLKARKMIGKLPDEDAYRKLVKELDDPSLMAQPNNAFLNIVNRLDFNVDLSIGQIVALYEQKYGEITLTSTDYNTPINQEIKNPLPRNRLQDIILNQRNQHLADAVEASRYKKIIIIYGRDHQDGLLRALKQRNKNWHKK